MSTIQRNNQWRISTILRTLFICLLISLLPGSPFTSFTHLLQDHLPSSSSGSLLPRILPIAAQQVDASFNPYTILGITKSASPTEVKRAYKKQAKNWHPDKNSDPSAQSRFQSIVNAYDILTDATKKADYDTHGHVRTKAQRDQEEQRKAYYAQQQRYNQQHGAHSQYHYGFGMDPAQIRRQESYMRETDDVGSASVRITGLNYDHMISSVTTQPHVSQGWLIYVFTHTCEPCNALNPTFAFLARNLQTQFQGRLMTGKINSEFENPLIRKLSIRSIPTIFSITITPSGEMTRQGFALSRDSRGVIQPPTIGQLREFLGAQVYPIQNQGLMPDQSSWNAQSSVPVAPLFDLTSKLGALPTTQAASTLKLRLMQFVSEHGTYPTATEPSSPYVHVYVISQHAHPSLLLRYLAHRFIGQLRFAHISLPLLQHSNTLMQVLTAHFSGVDIPTTVSEGSFILIQREAALGVFELLSDENMRLEEDYADIKTVEGLLQPFLHLHLPQFTYHNFDDLCYPLSATAAATKNQRECLILFVDSQAEAQRIALDLFRPHRLVDGDDDEDGSATTQKSLPKHLQLGWMNPKIQSKFYAALQQVVVKSKASSSSSGAIPAIILRAQTSTFTIFPQASLTSSTITNDLLSWIVQVNSNSPSASSASKIAWLDGKLIGGLPYLVEQAHDGSSGGGLVRTLIVTPLRWFWNTFTGNGAIHQPDQSNSTSGSALVLLMVFTLVFLLATTSMIRFVA